MQPSPTITPATRALLDQAIAHHRAGRIAEAERLYRQVLQVAPHSPDANHNLGLIASNAGRRDLALPLFQTALAVNPLQPQFLQSFATVLLELGRDADALSALERGMHSGVRNPALDALRERAAAMRGPNQPQREEELALYQLFKLELHAELQRECRRLLAQFPDSGTLWKIFGASLQVEGKDPAGALEALHKAAALLPHEADAQTNLAVALLQQQDFANAARHAQLAVQIAPQFVVARRNLGTALHGLKDHAGAAEQFSQALALTVDAATRINLAICFAELGRHTEALEQLRAAAREGSDSAALHCQIGLTLQALGKPDEALLAYRRALEHDPRLALAHNNLGNIRQGRREFGEAIAHYRSALDAMPNYADAHNNLGVALREQGRRDEAVASFNRALAWRGNFAAAHSNLGNVQNEMGRVDEALEHCRRAVEIDPAHAELHANLGHVLHAARRYDDALASFAHALRLKPGMADALSNQGALYREMGRLDASVQSCLAALQSDPDHLEAHSNLLFSCNYLAHASGAALLEHARRFGAAADRRARPCRTWPNTPDPARPLRIGLVSADLHGHPVGYFLDSVLAALQRNHGQGIAIHAYVNSQREDALSRRLQAQCAAWRRVLGMADEQLARQIHDDGIDILIDLSGHTTGTRLPMFAWKPAPVQASWLGYFATTGLDAIDYFVADPWTLPPAEEAHFSEAVLRLPETRLCFSAPDFDLPVTPLPALVQGYVTFGCCNGASKLGDAVIALWARILHAVPASRLLLKNMQQSDGTRRTDMQNRFAAHGINPERLLLEGPATRGDYLHTHGRIDIALDPFPYPGGTTTAEALWMGVPVLTLAGERFLARQGVGLLANAGLQDWIAGDAEDYLAKAVAFAGDLPALAQLRAGLRAQVLASPLFNASRFAGHFDAMLRGMWATWCQRQTNTVLPVD